MLRTGRPAGNPQGTASIVWAKAKLIIRVGLAVAVGAEASGKKGSLTEALGKTLGKFRGSCHSSAFGYPTRPLTSM